MLFFVYENLIVLELSSVIFSMPRQTLTSTKSSLIQDKLEVEIPYTDTENVRSRRK